DPSGSVGDKMRLLNDYRIRYIWYGKRERDLGSLDKSLPIDKIAAYEGTDLYEVRGIPIP
ncbi:hypothetical protein JW979_12950, partial [bacterium]|nr:hypothetical protein [candidate division CSSED10-310 bacterium]